MNNTMQKVVIGFVIGILSGLLGVGGGVFLVPIMVGYLGFAQHNAQATSMATIIPTAIFGSLVYGMHGNIDWQIAAELAAGSMVSAAIGARIMTHLPAQQLKRIFGVLLVLVGIRMVLP